MKTKTTKEIHDMIKTCPVDSKTIGIILNILEAMNNKLAEVERSTEPICTDDTSPPWPVDETYES